MTFSILSASVGVLLKCIFSCESNDLFTMRHSCVKKSGFTIQYKRIWMSLFILSAKLQRIYESFSLFKENDKLNKQLDTAL